MTMRKVIGLMSVQRQPVGGGERQLLKAGTPFEIERGSEEEAQLESLNAIRDAKESDIVKAQEDGLAPIVRRPRFRTRREIRAIQDSERDLADRGLSRAKSERDAADPGTGHGSVRSAAKSSESAAGTKGKRGGVL